jgi:hypothetical protein
MISPFLKGIAPTVIAFIASSPKASGHDGPSAAIEQTSAQAHGLPAMRESDDARAFSLTMYRRDSPQVFRWAMRDVQHPRGVAGYTALSSPSDTSFTSDIPQHEGRPCSVAAVASAAPRLRKIYDTGQPRRKTPRGGKACPVPPEVLYDAFAGSASLRSQCRIRFMSSRRDHPSCTTHTVLRWNR